MHKLKSKEEKVRLNKLVKLCFEQGDEFLVRIVRIKSKFYEVIQQDEFPVYFKTPIAQTILGHTIGEKLKYEANDSIKQITILDIQYNNL